VSAKPRNAVVRPGNKVRAAPKAAKNKKAPATRRAEQPLGVGVGDPFAVARLGVPRRLMRARPERDGVLEIGWASFGDLARQLAHRIARRFQPELVIGIAKGGVFVGSALSAALGADFHPVRVERRARDAAGPSRPKATEQFPNVRGKRVLVADDVANSGKTLEKARALAVKGGAKEVQAAVLVVRPQGARPEWFALETDELIVFGWDYQLDQAIDPGEAGV
jgi:hypothetical protein